MTEIPIHKHYDLEERTLVFARDCRSFVKELPRTVCNLEDGPQLIRSSGSIGANYIEANEAISRKDFVHRIKICRKESKESKYWLQLVDTGQNEVLENERARLTQEANEFCKIFGSIVTKSE
ncbi:four helix bundle protein [Candidatus Gottesmanbacteria bacterium]|nr:four helix bundle protein [Candidatus Gottesmanbacteria bacterium]